MEKHFMIDIETTGVNMASDDILQIGILELDFKEGFWRPGKSFQELLHTDRQPQNAFAKKYMKGLYERCNRAPKCELGEIRSRVLHFLHSCGTKFPIKVMGWNASNFDMPFLFNAGLLVPSYYIPAAPGDTESEELLCGDVSYQIYEMGGVMRVLPDVLQTTYKESKEAALKAGFDLRLFDLPVGSEHDAIYDCYQQTVLLNGAIKLLRDRNG